MHRVLLLAGVFAVLMALALPSPGRLSAQERPLRTADIAIEGMT